MWDPSITRIIWGISWRASNSCARTLNWVELGNCTKVPCKWTLTNLQNFLTISDIVFSTTPYTSPTIHKRYVQSQAFVMKLQLYPQLKLSLSYVYSSFATTDLTSHKETWMYYDIHEFFAWTFFRERPQ